MTNCRAGFRAEAHAVPFSLPSPTPEKKRASHRRLPAGIDLTFVTIFLLNFLAVAAVVISHFNEFLGAGLFFFFSNNEHCGVYAVLIGASSFVGLVMQGQAKHRSLPPLIRSHV